MATVLLKGKKGLVLQYMDDDDDDSEEDDDDILGCSPVEVAWNICFEDKETYSRVKGEDHRGDFNISKNGRCPKCHSRRVLFVILDSLFPSGEMPEFLLHLMSVGQAVLWSSQDSIKCKKPPTFLCHGYCPADPQKCGFNINWDKMDLKRIFISPVEDVEDGDDEVIKDEDNEDDSHRSNSSRNDDDSTSADESVNGETFSLDSDDDFDELLADIVHYRQAVSWVVLDNYCEVENATEDEDKLIRNMLAIAEAKKDWNHGVLKVASSGNEIILGEPGGKQEMEGSNIKKTIEGNVAEAAKNDKLAKDEDDEEEDDEEEDDEEELQKQKEREAEEKLLREKVASLFGPSKPAPAGRSSMISRMNARIAKQYDTIANQLAAKSKPSSSIASAPSVTEISKKPVTYGQDHEGDLQSSETKPLGLTGMNKEASNSEMLQKSNGVEKEAAAETGDEAKIEKETKEVKEEPTAVEVKDSISTEEDAKGEEVTYTAQDFPVSEDGSCPFCKSFDVLYIVLQYEDDDNEEELPPELEQLLADGNAYKMKKGNSELPSFQCRSCTYGFNLDWSKIDLDTLFKNKAAAMAKGDEVDSTRPVSVPSNQNEVMSSQMAPQGPTYFGQRHIPPGLPASIAPAMASFHAQMQPSPAPPPMVTAYRPSFYPTPYPTHQAYTAAGFFQPTQPMIPYAQQMPAGVIPGYVPGFPPVPAPVYPQEWYPSYLPAPTGMVPMYPAVSQASLVPFKKQKYTISVWQAPRKPQPEAEPKPVISVESKIVQKSSVIGASETEDAVELTEGNSKAAAAVSDDTTAQAGYPVEKEHATPETSTAVTELSLNTTSGTKEETVDPPEKTTPTAIDLLPPGVEDSSLNDVEHIQGETIQEEPLPPGIAPDLKAESVISQPCEGVVNSPGQEDSLISHMTCIEENSKSVSVAVDQNEYCDSSTSHTVTSAQGTEVISEGLDSVDNNLTESSDKEGKGETELSDDDHQSVDIARVEVPVADTTPIKSGKRSRGRGRGKARGRTKRLKT